MGKIDGEEIKLLLEKYFNGATTLKEEERIRSYFLGEDIDVSLLDYKPLFNCFSEEREHIGVQTGVAEAPLQRRFAGRKMVFFRLSSLAGVAALAVFAYILFSGRNDSLQLVVDGIDVNNRELAISKADQQLEKVNSLMDKYRKVSTRQLDNMKKTGDALQSLKIFDEVMSHNDGNNRL